MTYTALRSQHFDRLDARAFSLAVANPAKAERVHRACLRVAGLRGARLCASNPQRFAQAVRSSLGLGGILGSILGPIFQAILLQLIKDILPIVIAWLEEQLGGLATGGGEVLERECLRLAESGR